jgi:cell division protein FtsI/penicillin-binding protein 2
MQSSLFVRSLTLLIAACLMSGGTFARTTKHHRKSSASGHANQSARSKSGQVARRSAAVTVHKASFTRTAKPVHKKRVVYSPWDTPTYADSTTGDMVDGEDLVIRKAAVDALGAYNGTVVVTDPKTGRVMSIVNQKLALKAGFQPCSTIKLVAALAALNEGLIERNTMLHLYGRTKMNLTEALAHSNNFYFAQLGNKLGFDKVRYYAHLFGLGERAGLNIDGESSGQVVSEPPSEGVGMMTSFGSGIALTPLQLASLVSTVANGGTMYYLQYPRNQEEVKNFVPKVKRQLEIEKWVPEIRPGMMAAVEYGTARRAAYDPNEPIFGKTGTCTDTRTHMGWFGSFNDVGHNKLSVVVMLTGGKAVSGPIAAGIAGNVYKALSEKKYFVEAGQFTPAALVSTGSCCAR